MKEIYYATIQQQKAISHNADILLFLFLGQFMREANEI